MPPGSVANWDTNKMTHCPYASGFGLLLVQGNVHFKKSEWVIYRELIITYYNLNLLRLLKSCFDPVFQHLSHLLELFGQYVGNQCEFITSFLLFLTSIGSFYLNSYKFKNSFTLRKIFVKCAIIANFLWKITE